MIIIDYQEVKNGEGDGKETDNDDDDDDDDDGDDDDGDNDDGDDGADEKKNWQNCDVTCTPNTRLLFRELQHALTHVSLSAKTERWQTNAMCIESELKSVVKDETFLNCPRCYLWMDDSVFS